LFTITINHQSF